MDARVITLVAVCSEAGPVPLVFNVSVAVRAPVASPSTAVVVPDGVTVALSLSVTLTAPEPAVLTEALLLGEARLALNDSGPSTNWSSVAVTVKIGRASCRETALNDFVSEP